MKLLIRFFFVSITFCSLFFINASRSNAQEPQCGDLYNGRITFCSVSPFHSNGTAPYSGCNFGEQCFIGSSVGNGECQWVMDSDGLKFCFGGFESPEAVRASRFEVRCVSNCGGAGIIGPPGAPPFAAGDVTQTHDNAGAPVAEDGEGGYFSCVLAKGGFSQEVIDAINWQIDTMSLACGVAGIGEFIGIGAAGRAISAGAGGVVRSLTIPAQLSVSGAASYASPIVQTCIRLANQYTPTFESKIVTNSGDVHCLDETTIQLGVDDEIYDEDTGQILQYGGALLVRCQGGWGISTAIGCIPVENVYLTAEFLLTWGIGIGGGIAIIMISIAGFQIMTSSGDKYKKQSGQELLTAAITGLLFLIFAGFTLRLIADTILNLI